MVGLFWGYARDITHGIIKDHMGLAWFGKRLDFYPCSYSNSMKNMMIDHLLEERYPRVI
jgi:hypothetical protein